MKLLLAADADRPNFLNQLGLLEQALSELPLPVAFLRPAWFMENAAGDIESARNAGVIHSYSSPSPADTGVPPGVRLSKITGHVASQVGVACVVLNLAADNRENYRGARNQQRTGAQHPRRQQGEFPCPAGNEAGQQF